MEAHSGQHPDAEIYLPQPGTGAIPGARVPGEFGHDPHRYAGSNARRNYAATSPTTRASGKKKVVAARFTHDDRLIDTLMSQAFSAREYRPGGLNHPAARYVFPTGQISSLASPLGALTHPASTNTGRSCGQGRLSCDRHSNSCSSLDHSPH